MNSKTAKPKAILFYSRSFLAKFMPKALSPLAKSYRLLFLCNNNTESRWIEESTRNIRDYIKIYKFRPSGNTTSVPSSLYCEIFSHLAEGHPFNVPDRHVEQQNHGARVGIIQDVSKILSEILEHHEIALYVDEPIANLYNYYISYSLRRRNVPTVHFQAIFGGHGFFLTMDIDETKPISLSSIDVESRFPLTSIAELVERTFPQASPQSRSERYIYSYADKRSLLLSILRNLVKLTVRFARGAFNSSGHTYLDTETSSTAFHIQCLARTLLHTGDLYVDLLRNPSCLDGAIIIPLHFDPENICMYLSRYFQSQAQMIMSTVSIRAEAPCPIFIKEHPSQPGALLTPRYSWLRIIPNVYFIRSTARIESLITNRTTIVSLGSSLCIHGLLSGSTVILAGMSYISKLPGAIYCGTIRSFKSQIKNVLESSPCTHVSNRAQVLHSLQEFAQDYVFEASIDSSSQAYAQAAFLGVVKRISESPQYFFHDEVQIVNRA